MLPAVVARPRLSPRARQSYLPPRPGRPCRRCRPPFTLTLVFTAGLATAQLRWPDLPTRLAPLASATLTTLSYCRAILVPALMAFGGLKALSQLLQLLRQTPPPEPKRPSHWTTLAIAALVALSLSRTQANVVSDAHPTRRPLRLPRSPSNRRFSHRDPSRSTPG